MTLKRSSSQNKNPHKKAQTEFELSAQDQAADPPDSLYALIIATTDPYVPATVKNHPHSTMKTLQHTINIHRAVGLAFPEVQLSYSHMQPIGWNIIILPRRAPISETRASKTGTALAIMYAIMVTANVEPSQVTQWMTVLEVRWWEPRRMRMKMYFPGNYI